MTKKARRPTSGRWKRYTDSIEGLASSGDQRYPDEQPPTTNGNPLANRAAILMLVFLLIAMAVIVRLVRWQFTGNELLGGPAAHAAEPSRGRIVDRNGLLLSTDYFIWEVYGNPQKIRDAEDRAEVVASLSHILSQPPEDLRQVLDKDVSAVQLAPEATAPQCDAIRNLDRPELTWCDKRRARAYPQGVIAAHLIGITNYYQQGLYGVEASYDSWLLTTAKWPAERFPGEPQPLPEAWKPYLPSSVGHDLVLHLDASLQYMVEKQLIEAIAYHQAEAGTVIIMDPRSGGILALANYPAFDPNRFSDVSPDMWVNPAISQIYEPGSVFKVVTMAAALDSGYITPDSTFQDDGLIIVSGQPIRNAERQAYGKVTARDALAKSINVVSADIGLKMGADIFYRYVHQFRFGKLTEVDLNQESPGIVKEPGNPLWSIFDQATNSFGQGISVTSLQMINAVSAIANQGRLLQPQVVRALVKDGQVYYLPPRLLGQPIRPDTARTLAQMMVYTVDMSAYPHLVPGFRVAGKTGTAEIPTEKGYTSTETITSFIGFLPAADPQLVMMVELVKPRRSRWAEHVAVPVFGQVAQDAVRILEIRPDERMP